MWRAKTLMLAFFLMAGCGSGVPQALTARQSNALAHSLIVQGHASLADATPLLQSAVSFKIVASGVNLFILPDGSCRTDSHMQGGTTVVAQTADDGSYKVSVPLGEFVSGGDSHCKLQKALGELSALEIEASIVANQPSCAAYCKTTFPGNAATCQSSCMNGNRRITGSIKLSQDRLAALDGGALAGTATAPLDISLSTLGPSLSTGHGPDLVVNGAAAEASAHVTTETFSATDCAVVEGCIAAPGTRRLLRFDGTIQNLGDTDFLLGSPDGNPTFTYSACHNHYHLKDIMLYELLSADTQQPVVVGTANVVGRKQGFCMEDLDPVAGEVEGKFDCDSQGVSAGWSDVYDSSLDCQWIDVTGVPPGNYLLRITVNPARVYSESDYSNNSSLAHVTISP